MNRQRFLLGTLAAATTPIAAIAQPPTFARQYSLGMSVPLSGPLAPFGQQLVAGVQTAVYAANRIVLPGQSTYAVRALDDQNNAALAATNVQILAGDPSVLAVIGSLSGVATLGMLPQCDSVGLACIVPTVTTDALTNRGYRSIFRLATPDSTAGILTARRLDLNVKPVKTLIISRESGYGIDLAHAYLQQAHIDKRAASLLTLPLGPYDAKGIVASVIAQTPTCVYLAGTSADFGALLFGLHRAGFSGTYILSDGFYDPQTLQLYGAFLGDAWIATPVPPLDRIANASPDFFELRNALGATSALAVFSYTAAQIVLAAAQRMGALSRLALLQALRIGGAYSTLIGPFSFDSFGNPINANQYFYKVDGDKFAYRTAAIPSPYFF